MPRSAYPVLRSASVALALVLASACGGDDTSGDARSTVGGDSAAAAAAPSPAPPPAASRDDGTDSAAIANYRLDMDKVRGLQRAAVALHELNQRHPEIRERVSADTFDLDAVLANMNAEPEVRRAIEGAGISTRDYVLGTMALMQAAISHQLSKGGMSVPPGVSEENRRFMAEHEAEIEQVMAAMPKDDAEP